MSPETNNIDQKIESCLCNQIFSRAQYKSCHLKNLIFIMSSIPKKIIEKQNEDAKLMKVSIPILTSLKKGKVGREKSKFNQV